MKRTKFWRYRIPRRPDVWWHVQGRKMFDRKHSDAVRRMWGCGVYSPNF